MIGRDAVHRSVRDTFPQSLLMILGAQRRIHFGKRAERCVVVNGEEEMVWGDFTCDGDTGCFCDTDKIDPLLGGKMRNMESCPVFFG